MNYNNNDDNNKGTYLEFNLLFNKCVPNVFNIMCVFLHYVHTV